MNRCDCKSLIVVSPQDVRFEMYRRLRLKQYGYMRHVVRDTFSVGVMHILFHCGIDISRRFLVQFTDVKRLKRNQSF